MAAIEAGGIGSGLDVAGLVKQLVAAERAPHSLRLNRAEAGAKAKLSALGTVTSALDGVKSALDALKKTETFNARKVTNAHTDFFTASATQSVPIGDYQVEVLSLASAHKLQSSAFDKDAGLGAGKLSVTVDGKTFEVDIVAGEDKPADIVAAFNTAAQAAGAKVSASLSTSDDGQHLVFTASGTGAQNAVKITKDSGADALDALVYDPDGTKSLTEVAAAADARVKIDGLLRSSATNTFTDAVAGLTLEVKKADPGNSKTFTIAGDNAVARGAVQKFVTAYNSAIKAIAGATAYNATTGGAAALTGDAAMRGAASQLRNTVAQVFGAGVDMGFKTAVDGTLTLDASKFDAAMAADPGVVSGLFLGDDGLTADLQNVVNGLIGTDGSLVGRRKGLDDIVKRVGKDRESLDARMAAVEQRYRTQFTALDSLMVQMKNTSEYLGRQLASVSTNR
jgi:flagellar hook-associated protein 2